MKKLGLQIKSRMIKIVLFILYCIVLSGAVFYFRFPYTQTVKWVTALGNKNPDVFVSYNSMAKKFPNRIEIIGMTVYYARYDNSLEIIRMPRLIFKINPLFALFNRIALNVQGPLYSGNVAIDIRGRVWGKKRGDYTFSLQFQDVQLAQHPELNKPGYLVSQLEISGFGEFQIGKKFNDVTGDFEINSADGEINLSRFLAYWQTPIPYSKILIKGNLKEGTVDLTHIVLEGEEISGSASGELKIIPSNPWYSSIKLNGVLEPIGEQMKRLSVFLTGGQEKTNIPFNVTGTLKKPKPNFSVQSQGIISD